MTKHTTRWFPQRDRLAMAAYAIRNYFWSAMARTIAGLLEDLAGDRCLAQAPVGGEPAAPASRQP